MPLTTKAVPDNPDLWTTLALEYLDQGVTVFDKNLKLVAWNQRVQSLLELPDTLIHRGISIEEIFRFNAERDEYGGGNIEALVAERTALVKTFKPHVFERVRPDGSVIEIRGNPLPGGKGFVTTYTDITERTLTEQQLEQRVGRRTKALSEETGAHKKTAEALRMNELWIRQITDAVPVLIAYVNAGLEYQFANKKHLEWFNLNPDKLIGTSIFKKVEKHNQQQIRLDIDTVMQGELVSNEYVITDQKGVSLDISITFIPHTNEHHEIIGFFFLGQDLTDYKLTQRQLAESHKMQALGQMTGGIAHDFNNLLTIILGNLSLLDVADTDADEIQEIGHACRRAARRGSELIQRLLSFSRRQSLHPSSTDINNLIKDLAVLLQRTLGETIHIITELDDTLPNTLVDANQLETCLLNLALNARDAMPDGGTLRIRTSIKHIKPGSDMLLLSVIDEGLGMERKVLDRAFEPFFSTKAKGSGTGLGLSMVHGFVNQSGGHIEIKSAPGKGTAINILLPAASATATANEATAVTQRDSVATARILLVEDEPDVRDYISRALKRLGYEIEIANNGDAALTILAENQTFDLVLTDIVMPGKVDGIALSKHIARHLPITKVLLMTGYSEQMDAQLDTDKLIRKPFSTEELAAKISTSLAR